MDDHRGSPNASDCGRVYQVLTHRIERRGWCISLRDATPMQGDWRHTGSG